jgi:hypothetical protein
MTKLTQGESERLWAAINEYTRCRDNALLEGSATVMALVHKNVEAVVVSIALEARADELRGARGHAGAMLPKAGPLLPACGCDFEVFREPPGKPGDAPVSWIYRCQLPAGHLGEHGPEQIRRPRT